MRNLILVFIIVASQSDRCHCQSSGFPWDEFDNVFPNPFPKSPILGEVPYNMFDIKTFLFCQDNCNQANNVSYPSSYDYPRISWPGKTRTKYLDFSTNEEPRKEQLKPLLTAIRAIKVIGQVLLDYGVAIINPISEGVKDGKEDIQCFVVWNAKETYMIVNVARRLKDPSGFYITLGRGLEPYYLDKYISKLGVYIFKISSRKVIRLSCQNLSDSEDISSNEFFMSPSYLSNIGAGIVTVIGPCLEDQISTVISIYHSNNKDKPIQTAILSYNQTSEAFTFIMPLVWRPGMYIFKFTYKGKLFQSEAQVYSLMDYQLSWDKSKEMNNPKFSSPTVTIFTKEMYKAMTLNIFTFDLSNIEDAGNPKVSYQPITCISPSDSSKCIFSVQALESDKIIGSKQIGFFSMDAGSSEKHWSAPFSLVWLKSYKNTNTDSEDNCRNILKSTPKRSPPKCPDNVLKAKYHLSSFHGNNNQTLFIDLLTPEIEDNECYIQMVKGASEGSYNGVTCCYKKGGSLIYGQDYYIRDIALPGSYGWMYSPLLNPYEHFFFDRMPMIECCSFQNNKYCSQYWEEKNNVHSLDVGPDHSGNVFGDPHFMAFNSQSRYTFLARGEFWLIKCLNLEFGLQGRFYSYPDPKSVLKGIAIKNNYETIMISTKRTHSSKFDWSISINKTNELLPVNKPGIAIIQSRDTQKLYIYTKVAEDYFVHIELSRLHYENQFNEYLNLKVFLSNNFLNNVEGGLLGKIEFKSNSNSSDLYRRDSPNPIDSMKADDLRYFQFAQTWKIMNLGESFFSYQKEINEYQNLSISDSFTKIEEIQEPDANCGDLRFCRIDKHYYPNKNFYQETKAAHASRVDFNGNIMKAYNGHYRTCDHPRWPFIQLNSDDFTPGSVINVTGCLNQNISFSHVIQCVTETLTWKDTPEIKNDACSMPVIPTPDTGGISNANTTIYIVVALVALLLIVGGLVAVMFIKRRKNKMTSEFGTSSQNGLVTRSSISLGSTSSGQRKTCPSCGPNRNLTEDPTEIPTENIYHVWSTQPIESNERSHYCKMKSQNVDSRGYCHMNSQNPVSEPS